MLASRTRLIQSRNLGNSILVTLVVFCSAGSTRAELPSGTVPGPASTVATGPSAELSGVPVPPLALVAPESSADSCVQADIAANATRPAWDYAASTTQCGIVESDFGWLYQPMGAGVAQGIAVSSVRYGLTPKLDLRWGLTNHVAQSGGATRPLQGTGDGWISGRYRFHEQGRIAPAMAFLYALKIPMANPAKGFGTGFVDHQLILIASRDLGRYHLDFNTVGTIAGGPRGQDGAAQLGLAVTRPLSKRLSGILESYGGPQPGTTNRFGAAFTGATYTLRPQLVVDVAYARTYTAGSPRQQLLIGITYASRPGFAPLPRAWSLARLLGR